MNREMQILKLKIQYRMDLLQIRRLPVGESDKEELREGLSKRLMKEISEVLDVVRSSDDAAQPWIVEL